MNTRAIAESAVVGFPHDVKGNALYAYVTKYDGVALSDEELRIEINQQIAGSIGAIAKLDKIQFVSGLPKTRSGKIMRRILRKIASDDAGNLGDISTLLNPEVVEQIKKQGIGLKPVLKAVFLQRVLKSTALFANGVENLSVINISMRHKALRELRAFQIRFEFF